MTGLREREKAANNDPRALPARRLTLPNCPLSPSEKLRAGGDAPLRGRERNEKACLRGRATRLAHEELTAAAAAACRKLVAASDDGPAEGAAEGADKSCVCVCRVRECGLVCERASEGSEREAAEGGRGRGRGEKESALFFFFLFGGWLAGRKTERVPFRDSKRRRSRSGHGLPHLVLPVGRSRHRAYIPRASGGAPARRHGVFCELAKDAVFLFFFRCSAAAPSEKRTKK